MVLVTPVHKTLFHTRESSHQKEQRIRRNENLTKTPHFENWDAMMMHLNLFHAKGIKKPSNVLGAIEQFQSIQD